MRRKKLLFTLTSILFLLCLPFFLSPFLSPGFCSEKPSCAVMLFHPDTTASDSYNSRILSEKYAAMLDRLDMFEVMDYKEMDAVLESKNAGDLKKTCTDLGCALRAGNKLGVDFIIYGIAGNVGRLFSLDTTLVNVAGGNETQHAVYDFEGEAAEFMKTAPAENIKSLFGLYEIPPAPEVSAQETATAGLDSQTASAAPPADEDAFVPAESTAESTDNAPKNLRIGPRIGIGASDDGVEVGGGLEIQYNSLSLMVLLNDEGGAGALSYYLHPRGSSPYLSLVGSYYDSKHHGVDEIGRIYGLLVGYRLTFDKFMDKDFAKNLDIRAGLGAGYVNWDQTEIDPGDGEQDKDEEYIPIFEFTMGYMF